MSPYVRRFLRKFCQKASPSVFVSWNSSSSYTESTQVSAMLYRARVSWAFIHSSTLNGWIFICASSCQKIKKASKPLPYNIPISMPYLRKWFECPLTFHPVVEISITYFISLYHITSVCQDNSKVNSPSNRPFISFFYKNVFVT